MDENGVLGNGMEIGDGYGTVFQPQLDTLRIDQTTITPLFYSKALNIEKRLFQAFETASQRYHTNTSGWQDVIRYWYIVWCEQNSDVDFDTEANRKGAIKGFDLNVLRQFVEFFLTQETYYANPRSSSRSPIFEDSKREEAVSFFAQKKAKALSFRRFRQYLTEIQASFNVYQYNHLVLGEENILAFPEGKPKGKRRPYYLVKNHLRLIKSVDRAINTALLTLTHSQCPLLAQIFGHVFGLMNRLQQCLLTQPLDTSLDFWSLCTAFERSQLEMIAHDSHTKALVDAEWQRAHVVFYMLNGTSNLDERTCFSLQHVVEASGLEQKVADFVMQTQQVSHHSPLLLSTLLTHYHHYAKRCDKKVSTLFLYHYFQDDDAAPCDWTQWLDDAQALKSSKIIQIDQAPTDLEQQLVRWILPLIRYWSRFERRMQWYRHLEQPVQSITSQASLSCHMDAISDIEESIEKAFCVEDEAVIAQVAEIYGWAIGSDAPLQKEALQRLAQFPNFQADFSHAQLKQLCIDTLEMLLTPDKAESALPPGFSRHEEIKEQFEKFVRRNRYDH